MINPLETSEISDFFYNLTEKLLPRQFQTQTIATLLSGQNILLRAPTGAGKTETAVIPFLFAKTMGVDFPNKLIYVVPLRTLATSLRDRTVKLVEDWSHQYQQKNQRKLIVTLQTGDNPEDPRFEGDIIFCTIDQLLSSFLSIPYSVGRGSANVNAGVVFASYLVFDELHLLDPDRSFATTLELLKQVQGISPFLLMTATLTEELAEQIHQEIKSSLPQRQQSSLNPIQLINVEHEDLKVIETRQRSFQAVPSPLTASVILEDIQQSSRKRVIVLCNTVAQAQGLFLDLRDSITDQRFEVSLLHSRFLSSDRRQKEQKLKQIFGKDKLPQDNDFCQILISTQVIEAGMDITCDVMHTILCPMNSLLQRAGRCARFAAQTGDVKVYRDIQVDEAFQILSQTEDDDEQIAQTEQRSRRKFLPYQDALCELTWDVLQNHSQSSQANDPVGFQQESNWINQVHQAEDQKQAKKRQDERKEFNQLFRSAIFSGEQVAQELIRKVDNRSVFVIEDRSVIDLDFPEIDLPNLEAFSLPKTTLLKVLCEFQEDYTQDWIFKEIIQPKKTPEGYALPLAGEPITTLSKITSSIHLLVNPNYVSYDDEVGLQIGIKVEEGNYLSGRKANQSNRQEYRYRMDTYVGHLGRIWTCWNQPFPLVQSKYQSMRDEQLKVGGKFIKQKFFRNATREQAEALFEFLVFLAVITHDLGKLQIQWQTVMQGWQAIACQYFQGADPKGQLIAHTDYNPMNQELTDPQGRTQQQRLKDYEKQYSRPNHAVESAFLSTEILKVSLIPVLQTVFQADKEVINGFYTTVRMAAGRHHSAWAKGWRSDDLAKIQRESARHGKLHLHEKANEAIAQSWKRLLSKNLAQTLSLSPEPPMLSQQVYPVQEIRLDWFTPDQMDYQQLYWLVVRSLRICDERSVKI